MASKIDINDYRGVWVFVEQTEGATARVSLELLGKGRELADKLDVALTAFFLGESVQDTAKELIFYGVDEVIVADHSLLRDYRTELYTDIISAHAMAGKPGVLIVGAARCAVGVDECWLPTSTRPPAALGGGSTGDRRPCLFGPGRLVALPPEG